MRRNRSIGGVPVDLAVILRDVGTLLLMQAAMLGATSVVALAFAEFQPAAGFFAAGVACVVAGEGMRRAFATAPDPKMKHGMVIAASGWFATAAFGALAFLAVAWTTTPETMASFVPTARDTSGWAVTVMGTTSKSSLVYFRHPLHAMFEAMSGWTGSGLTMAIHEPSLPRSVQFYRSFIQYVGGVGVIVLTVSILSRPGSGSYALYQSEAREEKIHPSVVSTVRTVWKIFLAYSAVAIVALGVALAFATDQSTFDVAWQALNHGMTGLSTGGFSVTDNSIGTYNAPVVETVLLPIMVAGAIAFPVHYGVLKDRDLGALLGDLQTRWLFVLFAIGIVVLGGQLLVVVPTEGFGRTMGAVLGFTPGTVDALRDATFQWVSALSCTGFQSSPIGDYGSGAKVMLAVGMTIGGAAGSTVGGIKVIRAYTVSKGIQWQFQRVFLPVNTVVTVSMGDRTLDRGEMDREFSEAAIVSLLWVLLLVASSIVLANVSPDFSYADALFEVASAQGNVGLSAGITGPSMNPLAEAMFVLNMWIGRLEIIPVLVFARSLLSGLEP